MLFERRDADEHAARLARKAKVAEAGAVDARAVARAAPRAHEELEARVEAVARRAMPSRLTPAVQPSATAAAAWAAAVLHAAAMARAAKRTARGRCEDELARGTTDAGCAHARAARAIPMPAAIVRAPGARHGLFASLAEIAGVARADAVDAHAVAGAGRRADVANDVGAVAPREARVAHALIAFTPAVTCTVVWARCLDRGARWAREAAVADALSGRCAAAVT